MRFYNASCQLFFLSTFATLVASTKPICYGDCEGDGDSKKCTFTFKLNMFASELGYYTVEECGDEVMPTLGIEKGVTYHFLQYDLTNYFHPLGFAYYHDGDHADNDELEPGIVPPGSSSNCDEDMTCPAPMYMLNGELLGKYSNIVEIAPATTDQEDFGLDAYEPVFYHPPNQWGGYGEFSIYLKFDVDDFDGDIFYFCHIHEFVTGRIKLVDADGKQLNEYDTPPIPYFYETPSAYDKSCGTYGLEQYQLPHPECAEMFVCGAPKDGSEFATLAGCIDSMNCAMQVGMTTGAVSRDPIALFIYMMIPHHQNAVNMAKSLLLNKQHYTCDDITDDESSGCIMLITLMEIVNGQNYQIQKMRGILDGKGYLEEDDCIVPVSTFDELMEENKVNLSEPEVVMASGRESDGENDRKICRATCEGEGENKRCSFTASLNHYASEWGYYTFEECGDEVQPTLGIEKGVSYYFNQHDLQNYKHPMGFAYYPDGDHDDKPELEPGIVPPGSSSDCDMDMTCPAPMYILNDEILGKYSNNADVAPVTKDEEDFGLDVYEPQFFWPPDQWTGNGHYGVALKFDVNDYNDDIFYFCHIHQFVSGRIKFIDADGKLLSSEDKPEMPYEYAHQSEYDQMCGTTGLDSFQLPHAECNEMYVCNVPQENPIFSTFAGCVDSMNCAMQVGMTTGAHDKDTIALFNHQMIPHHQNAVNMAKALLKTQAIKCDDITYESDDCTMLIIVKDIMGGQNYQIQQMRAVLDDLGYPEVDDCPVAISGITKEIIQANDKYSIIPSSGSDEDSAGVMNMVKSLYLILGSMMVIVIV